MIRSVKLTNKYSNPMKIYDLEYFQREYTNIVNDIINHIWKFGYENKNRSKFNADKHKYYLAYMKNSDNALPNFQKTEVSKLEWKTLDECLFSIRPYNLDKKILITKINELIETHFIL